jgi:3-methyladenine DNA glycosylase AlkD
VDRHLSGMKLDDVLRELRSMANPENVQGMARFGISSEGTLGISIYDLRPMAKRIGKNHELAEMLWASGIHEAKVLASYIDDPEKVTEKQMEAWAKDFDSWDVVDQVCSNLFDQTRFAYSKAVEWSARDEEFVKRAGFVLVAALTVHDKKAADSAFLRFLPIIKRESGDDRNFVKKAVNWALRQIGKRNPALNDAAIAVAKELQKMDSKSARWIARDALRELTSEKVRKRFEKNANGASH